MKPIVLLGNQSRANHGNYPIFSLRKDCLELNTEFEKLLNTQGISFKKIPLPGLLFPEVGYGISFEEIGKVERGKMSKELADSFVLWSSSPKSAPLTDYSIIPPECVKTILDTYKKYYKWSTPDINKLTIQNTLTGETVELLLNYDTKEVTISNEEAWDWKFTMIVDVEFVD